MNDAYGYYETELLQHDVLTAAEEARLIARAQQGDQAALDCLIRHNQRLVTKTARRFQPFAGNMELLDLIQYGNMGMIEAIKRFDLSRGLRLSTYALYWIKVYIRRYGLYEGCGVRIGHGQLGTQVRIRKATTELICEGKLPTAENVAKKLGLTVATVTDLMPERTQVKSLDEIINAKAIDAGDRYEIAIPDKDAPRPEDLADESYDLHRMLAAMRDLPERQRFVIQAHYGIGQSPTTYEEIGTALSLSRERVRQICEAGLKRLRIALTLRGKED